MYKAKKAAAATAAASPVLAPPGLPAAAAVLMVVDPVLIKTMIDYSKGWSTRGNFWISLTATLTIFPSSDRSSANN